MSIETDITPKLREKHVWSCWYRGVTIEINHFDFDGEHRLRPDGNWTYYIYITEKSTPKFSEIWLPDIEKEWSSGRKYVTHDYMESLIGDAPWHCGITYYAKHGHTEGHRCVQAGCDYSHYWDEGKDYNKEWLLHDAMRTADWLIEHLAIKDAQALSGGK